MNTQAFAASTVGFLPVMGTWVVYLMKMPGHGVPVGGLGSIVAHFVGCRAHDRGVLLVVDNSAQDSNRRNQSRSRQQPATFCVDSIGHRIAIGITIGKLVSFGIPTTFMPPFEAMAFPTTLLIDENGVVQ